MEEDYYVTDWRGLRKTKRSQEESKTRTSSRLQKKKEDDDDHQEVKKLLKTQKMEELVFENWFQCDKCNKWRIIRGKDGFFFLYILFLWVYRGFYREIIKQKDIGVFECSWKRLLST